MLRHGGILTGGTIPKSRRRAPSPPLPEHFISHRTLSFTHRAPNGMILPRSLIQATVTSIFDRNTCRIRSNLSVTVLRTNVLRTRLVLLQWPTIAIEGL